MASHRSSRERRRRALEREVVRRQRGPLRLLVEPWLELARLLLEEGEQIEGWLQLDDLAQHLERREEPEAPAALVRVFVARIRLREQDGDEYEAAFGDIERALTVLRQPLPQTTDLAELEVEVWVHLGRLLLLSRQENAAEALRHARDMAARVDTPRAHQLELQAHRELAVALAHEGIDLGLRELGRAERRAADRPLPQVELDRLRATRAEMLANAGRVTEALRLLENADGGEPPVWALAQRATIHDLAGDAEAGRQAGAQLVERLQQDRDPRDLATTVGLVEALVAQARRFETAEERAGAAGRALRLLDEHPALPRRGLRLLAKAQELLATTLREPDETHALLLERLHLLEAIARDSPATRDRVELVRAYLQLGDGLLNGGEPREARQLYHWAIGELRRWPPEHPFVQDVLPLGLSALAHALGADELWLSARRASDEARQLVTRRTAPEALRQLTDVLSFRAVSCVNAGDPEEAAKGLKRDVAMLLGIALRERDDEAADLLDTVIELYLLRAEVLVDHLDQVDEALQCYDQALKLRGLVEEPPPSAVGTLLGAKGAVLNDVGRYDEAFPVLRRSLEAFEQSEPLDACDLALTRVQLASSLSGLGKPREALDEIGLAGQLLDDLEAEEPDPEDPRPRAIRSSLHMERGEALRHVGHPLLAVDELTRTVELCRRILDEEEDEAYEAELRLPEALMRRARCFLEAGTDHAPEAARDLDEAQQRFTALLAEEDRPGHRRRLDELRTLRERLASG